MGFLNVLGFYKNMQKERIFKGILRDKSDIIVYEGSMKAYSKIKNSATKNQLDLKIKQKGNNFEYKKEDYGCLFFENGSVKYKGHWSQNKKTGFGVKFYQNGFMKYKGNFNENKFDGFGQKFDRYGCLISSGIWDNGQLSEIYLTQTQIQNGYRIGKGRYDNIYIVQFQDNLRSGHGQKINKTSGLLEEEFSYKDDKICGFSKRYIYDKHSNQILSMIIT